MAWSVIDVEKGKPNFTQRVTLDGADFDLHFVWNMRSGWYMGVAAAGEVLFHPRKVVADRDLFDAHRWSSLCPPGMLVAMDSTGAGLDPGYEDLRGGPQRIGRTILAYGTP